MARKLSSTSTRVYIDTGLSLLILRFFAAVMLLYNHGVDKLVHVFTGQFPSHFDPIGLGSVLSYCLAAFAEGICTIFVMIGFYTRLAALFLIVNFAVAYYASSHELALLYLLCFVVIFFIGPGKISFDSTL